MSAASPPLEDPVPFLKEVLAWEIVSALEGWSEGYAADLLGTDCRRVSDLRAGRLGRFSLAKLIRLATAIDRQVDLHVTWTGRRFYLQGDEGDEPGRGKLLCASEAKSGKIAGLVEKRRMRMKGVRIPFDQ